MAATSASATLAVTLTAAMVAGLYATQARATEEPGFEVLEVLDDFEIRRYEPYLIAETEVRNDFESAGSEAFSSLVRYIGGANAGAVEIEMTAPVVQRPSAARGAQQGAPVGSIVRRSGASGDTFVVGFVLPSRFLSGDVPAPDDPRIAVRTVPERTVAVRRYSGRWTEEGYRAHEVALLDAVSERGLEPLGPPEWARYNAPFVPWFLRRNEVHVEVAATAR